MHALSRIQTRDPSNQAPVELRLRPHGHRHGHGLYLTNIRCTMPILNSATHAFHL